MIELEGRAPDSSYEDETKIIFAYDRTWQGYEGVTKYHYSKAEEHILSIDFELDDSADLVEVAVLLETIYHKGDKDRYQSALNISSQEANTIYHSDVHDALFFIENYIVELASFDHLSGPVLLFSNTRFQSIEDERDNALIKNALYLLFGRESRKIW